jgi:hypothetical protein
MPVSISGTSGITFPDGSLQTAAASPLVLRNRIINGAMVVDQRNAGASVTPTATAYTLDRWQALISTASKMTVQQTASTVASFTYSLGVSVASATTAGAAEYFSLRHLIEGYNVADLGYGTADAKTVTLSFWVKSSVTGTYAGKLGNSANNRSYVFTYSISSANTWEYKTITIVGDTTGTWLTTNGTGIDIRFDLGSGSNYRTATTGSWIAGDYWSTSSQANWIGTSGATFYITGVQLEQNTSATPFERRLYNQELANCQRYCYVPNVTGATTPIAIGNARDTTNAYVVANMPVTMRSSPSVSYNSVSNFFNSGLLGILGGTDTVLTALSSLSTATTNNNSVALIATVGSAVLTAYRPTSVSYANTNGILIFSSEL